ncbi:N-methyl-L-tryptophan oxidase [Halobacillus naozhouensis]|uniref:N-methyl-L-tryptophan oxidase n=1 Tax=Halobacillus naozhouensis TaxID=554880 RepID=A0ABY8IYH6_9BACI|nr:N-methyl-L-tryptophan oxidase [Halobacillus naozhouensis]WFT74258.1 N-methyl-L-tryptophan oxidase [Halobacillus naozhouensis]
MDADVAVIGVGTMGSMATWQLAKRGVSVLGFEKYGIGNDRSAVGGESRLFRTAYMEGKEYVPLLQDSQRLWKELEYGTGKSLLTLNGGLMIGDPDTQVMRNVQNSIEFFDLDHEVLQGKEAHRRFPQHRLFAGEIMVLDKNAGFLRPELAVTTAATQAEKLGASILRYTEVKDIQPDQWGVSISTDKRKYRVGKVLVTTGPWSVTFLPGLSHHLKARRLVLTWFSAKDITKFYPKNFPIFARMRKGFRLTGAPTLDGTMVKASNTKNPELIEDPGQLNRDVKVEELREVGEAVKELIPDLIPEPVRASVYMDAYTPDDHSVVGYLPGTSENVMIASGFSGHGFKMAPVIGKIAADLLENGKTSYDIEHMDPNRYVENLT